MGAGQGQRDAAIALKDTFGKAADDISSKAGDFHDLTADASLKGAHDFANTDEDLGKNLNGLDQLPPEAPHENPGGGQPTGGEGGGGEPTGPIDDNFQGTSGGQTSEGTGESTTGGDPVDVVSGQMITAQTDLALVGQLPLVLRRAYASGYGHGRMLGAGWSSTLDQRVVIDADGIRYVGDDAQVLHYPVPTQRGRPVYPAYGARWPLTWDKVSGDIRIEDPDRGWTRLFTTLGATTSGERETRPITALTNRNGHRVVYLRDKDGIPTGVQHSGGYQVAVDTAYTPDGFRLEALRYLDGSNSGQGTAIQSYQYDPHGRLIAVTDTSGVPYLYEYDDADRITARIDRNGFRYAYEYDEQGRVARGIGDDGILNASFSYEPEQRVTTVIDSLGHATAYHYDENQHIHKTVDALGHDTLAEYDRYGRLVSATDPLGNTTCYALDERGNPTRVDRPDGTSLGIGYGEHGRVGEIVWPDATRWNYAYDERGNLLSVNGPLGTVGTLAYDERGCLISSTDPLARTDRVESTGADLPLRVVDFDGRVTTFRRDTYGRIVETTDTDGTTKRAGWSPDGRILWREGPNGRDEYDYDPEGNLLRVSTPAGTTSFELGPFNKVIARVNPSGERLSFAYDTECRLASVTDSRGLTWMYTRDAVGRITAETDYDGRTVHYNYDAAGRLVERANAEGQRVAYTRDELGRIRELNDSEGGRTVYELDRNGRLLRAVSGETKLTYTYDPVGRILSESVGEAAVRSDYDAGGRRLRRTTPSDVVSEWTYDAHSRPLTLATSGGGSLTFAYNEQGRETHRYLGPAAALSTLWTDAGRLAGQHIWAYDAAGTTLVDERTYEYDQTGRLSRIGDHTGGVRDFTYAEGRVVQVQAATWIESYAYNSAGDLTQAALQQPAAAPAPAAEANEYSGSRVVAARGSTYEYDRQGRVVRRTRRTLSGQSKTWEYTWSCQDRLTRVALPDGTSWRYDYDPIGRRVGKSHLDADGYELSVSRFIWDGPQLVEETITAGLLRTTRTWDYEPGTFRPAAQTDASVADTSLTDAEVDRRFYAIVSDVVGTPRELVTGDGRIAWRAETDLWGERLSTVGLQETGCPLGFPGQYHDEETGWLYNYYRYYDPQTARYVSPDPLGLTAGPNQYSYVSDPLAWIDPLGLVELPTTHPRILNIGAGRNPMPGAYNIDLNPGHPDVVQMDALNMEGIPDGYFDVVHSISPYGFNPVNPETARIMAPGAELNVSGDNKRNKYTRADDARIADSGLQYDGQPTDLIDEHKFAPFQRGDGSEITDLTDFKTRRYTKPDSTDGCPAA